MKHLEQMLILGMHVLAYVVVFFVALVSYLIIGVVWMVFPVYACGVVLKVLWCKTSVKLEYLFKRGK